MSLPSGLFAVRLPQINVNDESALVIEWLKENGARVEQNEAICVVETTKSVVEVTSERGGLLHIIVPKDSRAETGQILAVVSSEPLTSEELAAWLDAQRVEVEQSAAKGWTVKAEILAKRHGIDIALVPSRQEKITEADVQEYLQKRQASSVQNRPDAEAVDLMDGRYPAGRSQRLLVIGGGNGAIQIADALAKIPGQRMAAILDDNAALHGKEIAGVPILGPIDKLRAQEMIQAGRVDAAVISVSTSPAFRARIFEEWSATGIPFANVIHPTVDVGLNVEMGTGNVLLSFCHLGACASIGNNNFLSPYCSIEHHCILGDHCSFGPGVVTSSRVRIGNQARFGTGIFIEPGVSIGAETLIGSGSIIVENIPDRVVLKSRISYVKRPR